MRRIDLYAILMISMIAGSPVAASTLYVSQDGSGTPPFESIETAAQTLQQAADAAKAGDEILVAAGVYTNGGVAIGSTLTNRVAVPDGVTLRSINGAEETFIVGIKPSSSNAVRCVKLGFNATLSGFTIRNGGTRSYLQDKYKAQSGGGVMCEDGATVVDCIVINNDAYNYGGGVYGGTVLRSVVSGNSALRGGGAAFTELESSVVTHNTASHIGAGVYRSEMDHSTVISNRSSYAGGGVYETDAVNSVIVSNVAVWVAPNYKWGVFSNVCTHPAPERGTNNFANPAEAAARDAGAPEEVFALIPENVGKRKVESLGKMDRRKAALGLIDLPPENKRKKEKKNRKKKPESTDKTTGQADD